MAATEEVWLPREVHNNDRGTTYEVNFPVRDNKVLLYTGMMANVSVVGEVSESSRVTNGVKQGCVVAPTLFSITWMDKVTNKEILERTRLPSMKDLLIRKNLR